MALLLPAVTAGTAAAASMARGRGESPNSTSGARSNWQQQQQQLRSSSSVGCSTSSGGSSTVEFQSLNFRAETKGRSHVAAEQQQERQNGRRQVLANIALLCGLEVFVTSMPGKVLAEEEAKKEADESAIGGLLSLFDPNETTKQGKKLPKAYLKSARDVVQTLRASFSEDSKTDAQFRRNADSAKGAIREYIASWRGAIAVSAEESYQALERVLRMLSEFYSKRGPTAVLPEDVRVKILESVQKADDAL